MKNIKIEPNEWRDSFLRTTLWKLPSVIAVPLLLFCLHIKWWTFGVLVVTCLILWLIDSLGYSVQVAFLAVRAAVAGTVIKRVESLFNKQLN